MTGSATATSGFSDMDEALPGATREVPAVRNDSNEAIVDRISSRTEFVGGLKLVLGMAVFRDPGLYRLEVRRQLFETL